jgi:hypothetical protein
MNCKVKRKNTLDWIWVWFFSIGELPLEVKEKHKLNEILAMDGFFILDEVADRIQTSNPINKACIFSSILDGFFLA